MFIQGIIRKTHILCLSFNRYNKWPLWDFSQADFQENDLKKRRFTNTKMTTHRKLYEYNGVENLTAPYLMSMSAKGFHRIAPIVSLGKRKSEMIFYKFCNTYDKRKKKKNFAMKWCAILLKSDNLVHKCTLSNGAGGPISPLVPPRCPRLRLEAHVQPSSWCLTSSPVWQRIHDNLPCDKDKCSA